MTPQEMQRMIDFILRSQADAVIRREQWEERWEIKMDRLDRKIDRLVIAVQEATKLSKEAIRESGKAIRSTNEQLKKTQNLEKSAGVAKKRSDSMQNLMKIALRLLAHQSKRLDALEQA